MLRHIQAHAEIRSMPPKFGPPADDTVAIRARGLGRYFASPLNLDTAPAAHLARALLGILGFNVSSSEAVRTTTMIGGNVLRDLSFDIAKGSSVCFTGATGSGKSVLLRLLAGALPPSAGRIELRGSVSSVLAIGDNLQPGLSALENIELQRRLRGIPAERIREYIDEVLDFAELTEFAQAPVRTFSSGMTMRLSLALALGCAPAILLMDDVLGVGDASFQFKCIERLEHLRANGCTLVMALSDETMIQQLATRVITLRGGGIIHDGPPAQAIPEMHHFGAADVTWDIARYLPDGEAATIVDIKASQEDIDGESVLQLVIDCDIKLTPQRCRPYVHVRYAKVDLFRSLYPIYVDVATPSRLRFVVRLPLNLFAPADYKADIALVSEAGDVVFGLKARDGIVFQVKRTSLSAAETTTKPLLTPNLRWEIEPVSARRA